LSSIVDRTSPVRNAENVSTPTFEGMVWIPGGAFLMGSDRHRKCRRSGRIRIADQVRLPAIRSLVECRTQQEEMKMSSHQMSNGRTSTGRYSIATVLANGGRIIGKRIFPLVVLAGAVVMFGDIDQLVVGGSPISEAQAVVGRPLTPLSVAGVARRTTRRAVRRHYYCRGVLYYHPCHY
jgi:hypothetical protein